MLALMYTGEKSFTAGLTVVAYCRMIMSKIMAKVKGRRTQFLTSLSRTRSFIAFPGRSVLKHGKDKVLDYLVHLC